ncbi:MAG: hypothetical protein Q7U57_04455 [Methylovulum sp.]|nr:hypothetical protein [Methylovulum sp.]
MGKGFIGCLIGVPVIVLVVIYLFFQSLIAQNFEQISCRSLNEATRADIPSPLRHFLKSADFKIHRLLFGYLKAIMIDATDRIGYADRIRLTSGIHDAMDKSADANRPLKKPEQCWLAHYRSYLHNSPIVSLGIALGSDFLLNRLSSNRWSISLVADATTSFSAQQKSNAVVH